MGGCGVLLSELNQAEEESNTFRTKNRLVTASYNDGNRRRMESARKGVRPKIKDPYLTKNRYHSIFTLWQNKT
jgi:hypothetical protein